MIAVGGFIFSLRSVRGCGVFEKLSVPVVLTRHESNSLMWITLVEPLVYYPTLGQAPQTTVSKVVVPTGYVTDGATIPRLLWPFFTPLGRWWPACVLHDWLYMVNHMGLTRKQCDQIFRQALYACGVPKFKIRMFYAAVRTFGWIYWRKDVG